MLNTLETYDLIDFFLPRNNKIFPQNKIKESIEAIHNDNMVRNRYKGIGVCNVSQIIEPVDLQKICKYYLVWHKPASSYRKYTSTTSNFQFSEYIDEFLYDPTELPSNDRVLECIKRLKTGWKYPIEIIVAYDTVINKGLIVAGTKHSLALYYIKDFMTTFNPAHIVFDTPQLCFCRRLYYLCTSIFQNIHCHSSCDNTILVLRYVIAYCHLLLPMMWLKQQFPFVLIFSSLCSSISKYPIWFILQ